MQLLVKYLKPFWKIIAIILVAHVVQAYSTLLLPTYTSGLVDVGIQAKGFEYAVPLAMSQEDYQNLQSLLENPSQVEKAYYRGTDGVFHLKDQVSSKEQLTSLEEDLAIPLALYQRLVYSDQAQAFSDQTLISKERDALQKQASISGLTYVTSQGVQAAIQMYADAGLNPNKVQFDYLFGKGFLMLGITLVTISSAVLAFYLAAKVGADFGYRIRKQLFDKVLRFSDHEIEKFSSASLITRTTNDVQQIQMMVTLFLRIMIFSPIVASGGLIYLFGIQPNIIWILGLSIAVIAVMVFVLFKLTMPRFRRIQGLFDRVNLIAREVITGIQVIRAFGRQDYEGKRFDTANYELQQNHLFSGRVMSMMMPFMIFVLDASSILIVWNGSQQIAGGTMQVGQMMAFISYSMQILISFVMLSNMSMMFPRSLVALGRIDAVLEEPFSIYDQPQALSLEAKQVKGQVTFNHVDFTYEGADEKALTDIDFVAHPGQTTAIIGSTGSGKSTILNLLMRYYDVSEGQILIDGQDIRNLKLADLRRHIGYVPQKGVLFSGTIASNIGFGLPDIEQNQLKEAAEIAHASEFINEKEEGMQAAIAQGGTNISGGQKQRLSIARAIAKRPEIYLFDDSFSALDYRTDASLRKALNETVKDATVIIVAQRISTILDADQIIVLDEGRIDGIGRHLDLMEKSAVYREIAESQLSQAELAAQAHKQEKEV